MGRSEISSLYFLQLISKYDCFVVSWESAIFAACRSANSLLGVSPVLLGQSPDTWDVVLQRHWVVPASPCLLGVLFVSGELVTKARQCNYELQRACRVLEVQRACSTIIGVCGASPSSTISNGRGCRRSFRCGKWSLAGLRHEACLAGAIFSSAMGVARAPLCSHGALALRKYCGRL